MRGREAGQATIEWAGLVLLIALVLSAAALVVSKAAGLGLAEDVLHAIVCGVKGGCDDGPDAVEQAYGKDQAAAIRRYAPNVIYETDSAELPIDFRQCRQLACDNGS